MVPVPPNVASLHQLQDRDAYLRFVVKRLVDHDFAGNESAAARALGVAPSYLHSFMKGQKSSGITLWKAVADYTNRSIDNVLGREQDEQAMQEPERAPVSLQQEKVRFHTSKAVEHYRAFHKSRDPESNPPCGALNGIFQQLHELSKLLP